MNNNIDMTHDMDMLTFRNTIKTITIELQNTSRCIIIKSQPTRQETTAR